MLLPDDIEPKNTLYYNGALILSELKQRNKQEFFHLYQQLKKKYNISLPLFILCLDWLYLIDAAKINHKGVISLCS